MQADFDFIFLRIHNKNTLHSPYIFAKEAAVFLDNDLKLQCKTNNTSNRKWKQREDNRWCNWPQYMSTGIFPRRKNYTILRYYLWYQCISKNIYIGLKTLFLIIYLCRCSTDIRKALPVDRCEFRHKTHTVLLVDMLWNHWGQNKRHVICKHVNIIYSIQTKQNTTYFDWLPTSC